MDDRLFSQISPELNLIANQISRIDGIWFYSFSSQGIAVRGFAVHSYSLPPVLTEMRVVVAVVASEMVKLKLSEVAVLPFCR